MHFIREKIAYFYHAHKKRHPVFDRKKMIAA